MKTQRIEGVTVLAPKTPEQLREAVNSGQPFLAPENLAEEFGLPTDAHLVDGEDVSVLEDHEDDGVGV